MTFIKTALRMIYFIIFYVSTNQLQAMNSDDDSKEKKLNSVPPIVTAIRVDSPPVLDGDVLDDPAWKKTQPTTGFWQTAPEAGQPASEKTEVRIIHNAETLYFGIICYDREPERIIVSDSRRDASLDETDCFQFVLDTYNDKQNGFVFGTNPAGIEYDAQVTNEGQGSFGRGRGRQQSGSGGGFNKNWDGSWEVRTKVSDIGWSAEFAIPFRTLRFGNGESQTWGVNFQRNIRRRNEKAFWAPLPRQFNIQRISLAGSLTGLKNISQRNLKVMPYSLGEVNRLYINPSDPEDVTFKSKWEKDATFGLDVKYSITPSLTLDATYNTDFAQVEVDEQQINLNRFNLFFPEKRPFFLENAGFFSVGSPGEVEMFFSRRIGISEDRNLVPIFGGLRLSGKAAGLNIGLLNMQTESVVVDSARANNFTVARINKELPNRSAIGAIFVNRQGTGDLAPDNDYNRTLALDGRIGIGKYGQIKGFAARTFTPDFNNAQYAFKLGANYDSEAWRLSADYTEVAENFNPEVGFLQRSGFRKPDLAILYRHRPSNFIGILELRPHAHYTGFWNFDGFQETGYLHIDNHWEWKNGYQVHTGVNFTREGVYPIVTEDDSVTIQGIFVPPGTYNHAEAQIVLITNQGAWWSIRMRNVIGGFFGGSRISLNPTLQFRVGETINTQISLSHNNADLPEGNFVTNLIRARISYSFTPRLFIQGLIQYNDHNDIWSTNLRLGWLQTANAGLFIVYNDIRETDNPISRTQSRSLIVKYNRLFDLLN